MSNLDTRTKILDVAESLVRQSGADGFSYADLSSEIGIRKASIHYHFPKKTDLLGALMKRYSVAVMEKLRVTNDADLAKDQLAAFLQIYRGAVGQGSRLCLCVVYSLGSDRLTDETRLAISEFRNAVLDWLREVFEKASHDQSIRDVGDPGEEANAALALVEGAQIAARLTADLDRFDRATVLLSNRLE